MSRIDSSTLSGARRRAQPGDVEPQRVGSARGRRSRPSSTPPHDTSTAAAASWRSWSPRRPPAVSPCRCRARSRCHSWRRWSETPCAVTETAPFWEFMTISLPAESRRVSDFPWALSSKAMVCPALRLDHPPGVRRRRRSSPAAGAFACHRLPRTYGSAEVRRSRRRPAPDRPSPAARRSRMSVAAPSGWAHGAQLVRCCRTCSGKDTLTRPSGSLGRRRGQLVVVHAPRRRRRRRSFCAWLGDGSRRAVAQHAEQAGVAALGDRRSRCASRRRRSGGSPCAPGRCR